MQNVKFLQQAKVKLRIIHMARKASARGALHAIYPKGTRYICHRQTRYTLRAQRQATEG